MSNAATDAVIDRDADQASPQAAVQWDDTNMVTQAEATLRQRTILSPIDAIVTERPSSAGEFITQDGYVAALAQLDPLHVEVYLPIVTYGQISVGSIATIYPEPPISGQYSAKAIAVDSVFDPASGTYGVRLELENPDSHLPAGQRCRLSLAPR
ncbi:efflux RND transporter periplasmic adaptor subunit [Devosia psychrophila]|uniref:Barrel-sandwich domain of CusB or HlyD membrane-fusion n=1 Tax=Devosia psychrophila TaxID=728005 RepID=A0A1I1S794_9HYPH|nr:HlyD family efflux transporter periplasmic adaptor subunit [Devosia psychrophila]SFD42389.1 Barrel-sandwich domain of CusB or HlyD membrane-fusion [Devosia psychrophila]